MSEFFVGFPSPPGHPAARFTYSPSWPQPDGTVTFNGSASSDPNPNATLQYRWDWTNDRRWDTPWSTSPVARHAYGTPGTYTAVLQVNDTLGLLDDAAQQLRVDGSPPITTAALSGPSGLNGWYTGNVTVGLAATDDVSGGAWTNYSVDNGVWQTYDGAFLVTGDGDHSLSYFSTDNAGNIEATQAREIKIDGTPPVTSTAFRGTVNGSTFLTPINVTLLPSDVGSGVAGTRYNIDDGPWATYAAPFNVSNTGSHQVRYDSLDVAGNPEPTNGFDVVNGTISGFGGLSSKALFAGTSGSAGWYTSAVNVTLALVNGTSPPDSIVYRIDGSPWRTYADPFLLSGDGVHRLDYNATNGAGLDEVTRHATIQIDTTPPASTATFAGTPGNNGWFTSNVTVRLDATDASSGVAAIHYRVDDGPWQDYTGAFILVEGRHALAYYAVDVAGLVETAHSASILIDTTPPTTTAVLSGTLGANGWYISNVTVSLNATDASSGVASIFYRVDSGSWENYTGSFSLADGRHVVEYYATDQAGNAEPATSRSISIDTMPPQSTITLTGTLGEDGWYISNVTISLAATDATSGVASITYRVDNGLWATYSGPFTLSDGRHVVQYGATDVAGLRESVHTATIDIDTLAPVTVGTLFGIHGDHGWFVSHAGVALNATDSGSGVANLSFRLDGGTWGPYAGPFTLGDGRHLLDFFATDLAGNAETIQSVAISIDTTAPASSGAISGTLGDDGWYVTSVSVALSASDIPSGVSAISYRLDNGSWQTYTGPFGLGEGRHFLEFFATDLAGLQETVRSASVFVDTTSPSTTASFTGVLGDHGRYVSNVSMPLNPTDGLSGVRPTPHRLDGGLWIPYTGPFVLSDDGKHVLEVFSVDRAGNGEPVRAAELDVEKSNPTFVFVSPRANVTTTPVSISWTNLDNDSEVVEYAVSVDGGPFTSLGNATNVTRDLSPGPHVIRVRATDLAGLTAEASLSLRVEFGSGSGGSSGPPLGASVPFLMALDVASIGAALAYVALRVRRRLHSKRE